MVFFTPSHRMALKGLTLAAVTAVVLSAPVHGVSAAEEDSAALSGRTDFETYCISCHGRSGKGDGPVAFFLEPKPTDLTQLAANEDGEFPAERLFHIIDGREELPAHGFRDMPVWGFHFGGMEGDAKDADVKLRINNIIAYIETLQEG